MLYYAIINFISVVVCVVFGCVFLTVPVPNNKYLYNYKISLKFLAVAYFVFGLLNILIIYSYTDQPSETVYFFSILLSSLQALLFTSSLLTLFNPVFVNRKFIIWNLIPIISFSVIYSILIVLLETNIFEISQYFFIIGLKLVTFIFIAYYCFQLGYYILLFNREKKKYQLEVDNYFSSSANLKLVWVAYMFYSALIIGIMAFAFQLFYSYYLDIFFSLSIVIFYFIFSIKYINYNKIFELIELAIVENNDENVFDSNIQNKLLKIWKEYKQEIYSEKLYLKVGITLNDLARLLCIGRSTLSNFINNEEGVSFNTWINTLRINDAISLFKENPEYTIAQISELTGFSEQSNFSRQFKLVTGQSPSVWRKNFM